MSILVVGDLHGKIEIARELLQDRNQSIIFIGDYLDSHTRSITDQVDLLRMVLDAINTRTNVLGLMGNHELSYLDVSYYASGWRRQTDKAIDDIKEEMVNKLAIFTETNGFLLTHAGVSCQWLPGKVDDIAIYLTEVDAEHLFAIGRARGGLSYCGGPLWCDWYNEFQPIRGISQICGHTGMREGEELGIISYSLDNASRNYNIDCLDWSNEVLELSNNEAKIVKI